MSRDRNITVARSLLDAIGRGDDPEHIAALFSEDVAFEIPGDTGVLPWIGHHQGRASVVDFIRGLRQLTEPIRFEVVDILASDDRAVIVGQLETRIKKTGRVTATAFAHVLTIRGGIIERFQMLEDSFDVSKAARG